MGVVTISREVGSYGDEIAKLAAEKLNYKLIDREAIHEQIKECDLDFSKACSAYEEEVMPNGFFERLSFSNPAFTARFFSLNYEAAEQGNVVIVGRGAQLPLSRIPGVLKVRVVAPESIRVERIKDRMGLPKDQALDYVISYGRERKALMQSIYHSDLYDLSIFDLVVNTAQFSLEDSVDIVVTAAQKPAASSDQKSIRKMLKDLAFAKDVESQIKKKVSTLPSRDISVEIGEPGEVILEGLVLDSRAKEKAEKIASEIPGVTKVVNRLRTTSLRFA